MKKFFVFLLLSVPVWAVQPVDPVFTRTMDAIQTRSLAPFSLKWSRQGNYLAYLKPSPDAEVNELWVTDLKTNREMKLAGAEQKSNESEAEKELKERMRIGGGGVTFFSWFHNSEKILYKNGGKLWQVIIATGKKQVIPVKLNPVLFPLVSPDDNTISIVSNGEIYLVKVSTGKYRRLTKSASDNIYNGMADFNAAEELDRYQGMWWSPDNRFLYFTHVDESRMAKWALPRDTSFKPRYQLQRYPVSGGINADVSLYRACLKTGNLKKMPVPLGGDWYLVRVHFMGEDPTIQILSRDQKNLYIYRYRSLKPTLIYHEHDACWLNLNKSFHYFPSRNAFLWTSEESGINQIYLVYPKLNGTTKMPMTHEKSPVLKIVGVSGEQVYFTESADNPTENRLMNLNLNTGRVLPVEEGRGWIRVSMSGDTCHYLVFASRLNQPPVATLVTTGKGKRELFHETIPDIPGLARNAHVQFHFTTTDNVVLYGVLDRPAVLESGRKYPVLVYTYGGPHEQVASSRYSSRNDLWDRYLNMRGICVFRMDNRGSSDRSRAFERAIYHNMGDLELKDQIAGLDAICKKFTFLDRSRAGIWGWSYGGYMTCMAMTRFAGQFKVGVAVAPVTDWHMYDSAYTERYMGTAQENPDGYRNSSVLTWAGKLRGKLLIMAGVSDDNVHFHNTELLLNKFVETNRFPDLMVYPGKKHSIRGRQTRKYLFWRISDYFISNL
jgi:dipeptidyl-peptidase 4